MSPAGKATAAIKELARECGFARVGIAPIDADTHDDVFQRWLAAGCHAEMAYLARNAPVRRNPSALLDGAATVICLLTPYAPPADQGLGPVARYARGRDYHRVLKRRAHRLMDRLREKYPAFQGRAFVDATPLAERSLAVAAGLGWIGANGCLVSDGLGSYVLLCEIVCNLPLETDVPVNGGCDNCRACIDACPTGAITEPGLVDARKCLSYHTIENRGKIPQEYWPAMAGRLFGCDACQAACPHNRDVPPGDAELIASTVLPTPAEVLAWDQAAWDAATRGLALRRADLPMLMRNAVVCSGAQGDAEALPMLRRLRKTFPDLKDALRWAISQIERSGRAADE